MTLVLAIVVSVMGVGCGSSFSQAGSGASTKSVTMTVSNQLGRTVAEIWRKDCDASDRELVEIENSRLATGDTRRFLLPTRCLDLVAFDERGRMVGQQKALHLLPGTSWVLRR